MSRDWGPLSLPGLGDRYCLDFPFLGRAIVRFPRLISADSPGIGPARAAAAK